MLKQEDRMYVHDQLCTLLRTQGSYRSNLAVALPDYLQDKLQDNLALSTLVLQAIDLCIRDSYRMRPPALYLFLHFLIGNDARVAEQILPQIKDSPSAALSSADPFNALLLNNRLPFLGRPAIRGYLRSLLQKIPRQPVIVINGRTQGGKTYTRELVNHARFFNPEILHCYMDLQPGEGASMGPGELASDLVVLMGGDPRYLAPPQTNTARWTKDLANDIARTATASQQKCWIFLDGFKVKELWPDTLSLIVKLSRVLTSGTFESLHRLILSDFDHTLLPLQPGSIGLENIPDLEMAAVRRFVADLVGQSGEPIDVGQIIDAITSGLSDPIDDLPELQRRLNDLIAVLDGQNAS
jgi:hypothetical protein